MKKILVVDDDPVVVRLLENKLHDHGYEVLAASDGLSALKKAKKEIPDLIIADYLMPRMDGFTFYKSLKKEAEIAQIPVLILTERAQMGDSFRALGIEVFLTKPFMMEGLLAKIAELIGPGEMATTTAQPAQPKSYKLVLIAGTMRHVIQDMQLQLQAIGCKTLVATSGIDTLVKCLEFNPDIILLDVAMGDAPGHKVITLLRNMPKMLHKIILVYNYFPQEGVDSLSLTEDMGSEDYKSSVCMSAGATEFLGRFYPAIFLQRLQRYLYPGN